jgi:dienelactone hydrolase
VSGLDGLGGLNLERAPRFGPVRRALALLGLLLGGLAWVQVGDTGDVEVVDTSVGAVPVTLYVPQAADAASPAPARAGVVVAHGFAGSRALMHTGALALARAGNVVAVPDLAGHGASPVRLPTGAGVRSDAGAGASPADTRLTDEVLAVAALLAEQAEVDPDRLGALGHSMGSGAVLRAGIQDPGRIRAVVAVSPTDAPVDASAPRNLLLLAGELEAPFAANAERLLAQAGGASDDLERAFVAGDARAAELVAGVEHVTILFSPAAHGAAADWFARALPAGGGDAAAAGAAPGTAAPTPTGRFAGVAPITWWALHLLAVVAIWRAVIPVLAEPTIQEGRSGRGVTGLIAGAVAATLLLGVLGVAVDLGTLAGMLVGPAVVVWLALAGIGWVWLGDRPGPPGGRDLVWGLALLAVLVAAFGAMAPQAWLPFFPVRVRALLVLPFAVALLPWSVAFAAAIHDRRPVVAFGWWVSVSVVVVVGLNAAANVVDDLGFVRLIAPALPVLLGLIHVVAAPVRRPWATAIATAGFLAWTIAALFPLV